MSSVISVQAEESSMVFPPCHRTLTNVNSPADAAEGLGECFQPFVFPCAWPERCGGSRAFKLCRVGLGF